MKLLLLINFSFPSRASDFHEFHFLFIVSRHVDLFIHPGLQLCLCFSDCTILSISSCLTPPPNVGLESLKGSWRKGGERPKGKIKGEIEGGRGGRRWIMRHSAGSQERHGTIIRTEELLPIILTDERVRPPRPSPSSSFLRPDIVS